jgi:thiamine-phosphate pyrophosphorylase
MVTYYITDRRQFPGSEAQRRARLLAKIAEAARCGVDFVQLREKDLPVRELEQLAREAARIVRRETVDQNLETRPRLLINSRIDVALAAGADGVHLTSIDISAGDARAIWARAGAPTAPIVAVSCHTVAEVALAEAHGADFAVFAPVFEKGARPGVGLQALRAACGRAFPRDGKVEAGGDSVRMPVLALGGVTLETARACIEAGAAGIAAIRLFQEHDVCDVVARLQ